MKKQGIAKNIVITSSFFVASCATPYVWEHTDPNSKDIMPDTAETREYIEKNNLEYAKDEKSDNLLVEKSTEKKAGNYILRIVGVPPAILLDAIGIIGEGMAANSNSNSNQSKTPTTSYQPNQASPSVVHSGAGISANQVGNTTYFSDGTTANKIGSTTYYSDGTTSNRVGNTTYNSDGSTSNRVGNTTYNSDGTTVNKVGNSTYGSDGTVCNHVGSSTYCH